MLKDKRKRLGLNQANVAEMLKIGLRTYRRIETGVRPPNKREAKQLAKLLLLDIDKFWNLCEEARDEVGR